MRVLLINNHHSLNGGSEKYYFGLANILSSHGHKIAYFSMNSDDNTKSRWSKYFVSKVDFSKNSTSIFFKKIRRMFYSIESKRKIGRLLNDFKPDIVHINNIYYYISASILSEITKRGIPIIQTVHDYQLISPNLILFYNGKISEITKKHKYYRAFLYRNIKGSYIASIMAVIVSYIQYVFRLYERNVSIFIAPSEFMKNKLIEYGFPGKKIIHLPNFVEIPKAESAKKWIKTQDRYILFFGRLTEHKGVKTLLKAANLLPKVKFKIIGGFGDKQTDIALNKYLSNPSHNNLQLIEFQNTVELTKSIRESYAVVVPSIWFENQPYSVLEAYALSKPVIASNIGGIPEIVVDGSTGYLFKFGNHKDLVSKINKLWNNKDLTNKMGVNAKKYATQNFSPEKYYQDIIKIYKSQLIK